MGEMTRQQRRQYERNRRKQIAKNIRKMDDKQIEQFLQNMVTNQIKTLMSDLLEGVENTKGVGDVIKGRIVDELNRVLDEKHGFTFKFKQED